VQLEANCQELHIDQDRLDYFLKNETKIFKIQKNILMINKKFDKFYYLAKQNRLRSRAAFKLMQLNWQFHFLENNRACLDLCAAPGSWLQVAQKYMPVNSILLGLDLVPIRRIPGVSTIIADILAPEVHQKILQESKVKSFDIVLHDGAPKVGGIWSAEACTQSILTLNALRIATICLRTNGTFISKVFRSKEFDLILSPFKQLFKKVIIKKPAASRDTSAETYICCFGFRVPISFDQRLLDPRFLFNEAEDILLKVS
jgi:AdoMet-dependent rRNA methyltransferase SPB1